MRNGALVNITDMTSPHIANSLRMIARNWRGKGHTTRKLEKNKSWKNLEAEARKRCFYIHHLDHPIELNGRMEWIEVIYSINSRKIIAGYLPGELDDRLKEE